MDEYIIARRAEIERQAMAYGAAAPPVWASTQGVVLSLMTPGELAQAMETWPVQPGAVLQNQTDGTIYFMPGIHTPGDPEHPPKP